MWVRACWFKRMLGVVPPSDVVRSDAAMAKLEGQVGALVVCMAISASRWSTVGPSLVVEVKR